ncbi:glutathione S-transferase family protein [Granulosicoccus antarcticus]|uniref:Glutathione S-transferase GST-6.0 n=1 Tax=Granulosicoccus antarcticus IMCC3135 TaxID=1192854 RepID=A0A2Z2P3L9_9GAMM|nr:glutathione S-transferase family protein [Granulosicoccus antarcticus]ASJ76040.1 Glutathione S-transferase GST-6.0 [Granulosicoccus antarcticus IMCC3135]
MTLKLYTSPGSIGVAVHIALEESGLDYELIRIDFASGEQLTDQYRQVNPKLRVPALLVNDQVLTETPAILVYLAQLAPASILALPTDPLAFAQLQSFNSYLSSTVHIAHAHKKRGRRWADDANALTAMTAYVPVSMSACFELIETEMLQGDWVHGEAFSISDPYLFALSLWMEGDGVDPSRYPKIQAHRARMLERESVLHVMKTL